MTFAIMMLIRYGESTEYNSSHRYGPVNRNGSISDNRTGNPLPSNGSIIFEKAKVNRTSESLNTTETIVLSFQRSIIFQNLMLNQTGQMSNTKTITDLCLNKFVMFYIFVILTTSVFGNIGILTFLFKNRRLKFTANLLVAIQCFVDIIYTLIFFPLLLNTLATGKVNGEGSNCLELQYINCLHFSVTMMTLATISYDRCVVMTKKMDVHGTVSKKKLFLVMSVIWAESILMVTFTFDFSKEVISQCNPLTFLTSKKQSRKNVLLGIINGILPSVAIVICFSAVIFCVSKNKLLIRSANIVNTRTIPVLFHLKSVKRCVVLLTAFLLPALPTIQVTCLKGFKVKLPKDVEGICMLFWLSNVSLRPFIYLSWKSIKEKLLKGWRGLLQDNQERRKSAYEMNEEEIYGTQTKDERGQNLAVVYFKGWNNFRAGIKSSAWTT